jgi:integrator complex subunit 11
MFTSGHIA